MRTIDGKPEYRNGLVSDGVWGGNTIWESPSTQEELLCHFGSSLSAGGVPRNSRHFEEMPNNVGELPWPFGKAPHYLGGGGWDPCHFCKVSHSFGWIPHHFESVHIIPRFPILLEGHPCRF